MSLFRQSHLNGHPEGFRRAWEWVREDASLAELEYIAALKATPGSAPLPPSSWDYVCDAEDPDLFLEEFRKGVLCFFAEVVFALQWEGAGPSSIWMEALIDRDMDEEQEIAPPGSSGEVEVVRLRAENRRLRRDADVLRAITRWFAPRTWPGADAPGAEPQHSNSGGARRNAKGTEGEGTTP